MDNTIFNTLNQISHEIGQWSLGNFGQNEAKPCWIKDKCEGLRIGPVAAVLGMGEEMGEMMVAVFSKDLKEVHDGYSDILIYAADFCERFGIQFGNVITGVMDRVDAQDVGSVRHNMTTYYGQLAHHVLKSVQGIRGYEDGDFAMECIYHSLVDFLWSVTVIALPMNNKQISEHSICELLQETWVKVVSKRNWVSNPQGVDIHRTTSGSEVFE